MITTIIPTYRRPKLLLRALRSAQQQNIPGHTILILDNASGDDTFDIIQKEAQRDPRIEIISHKTNIGALSNFIYGYNATKSQYFNFLSDDDLLLPNFYEKALSALAKYPDAGMYAASTIHVDENGTINRVSLKDRKQLEYWQNGENISQFLKGDFSPWTSIIFRKSLTDLVGGVKEIYLIDEDLILRTIIHFPCISSSHPAALYISNPDSFSSHANLLEILEYREDLIQSIQKYQQISDVNKRYITDKLRYYNEKSFLLLFAKNIYLGRLELAEKYLKAHESWNGKKPILRLALNLSRIKLFHLIFLLGIYIIKTMRKKDNFKKFKNYYKFLQCS